MFKVAGGQRDGRRTGGAILCCQLLSRFPPLPFRFSSSISSNGLMCGPCLWQRTPWSQTGLSASPLAWTDAVAHGRVYSMTAATVVHQFFSNSLNTIRGVAVRCRVLSRWITYKKTPLASGTIYPTNLSNEHVNCVHIVLNSSFILLNHCLRKMDLAIVLISSDTKHRPGHQSVLQSI